MALTKVSYSMINGSPVNVLDYGAVGDGVTDDTAAIQAAIDFAQDNACDLRIPAGIYKITDSLTVDGAKPLSMFGAGRATFDTALIEQGTVIKLATTGKTAFVMEGGLSVKHIGNFTIQNTSGGSTEIAFGDLESSTPYFAYFSDITIDGFEHGFKFHRSLYLRFDRMVIRNCDYGIDCWQFTGTPPYILNSNAADGYYNNVITVRDSQIVGAIIGYRLVGACIDVRNCDSSNYTGTGFVFGSSDFSGGCVSMDQLYTEGGTTTAIAITKMSATVGTIFLGGSDSIGIDVNTCNVSIDNLQSYGDIDVGVRNTNGKVFISGGVAGGVTNAFTNVGTGVTRQAYLENVRRDYAVLNDGQSMTISTACYTNRIYQLDVYGSDNGNNFGFRVIQNVNQINIIGTKPSNLTVQSIIDINGNYNVVLTNSAGTTYQFTIYVNWSPAYYSISM